MVQKREIFGFSLFDFANSAYTTVIITAIYATFFTKVIGTPFQWSITLSASYLIVLIISPIAGAIADFRGNKKTFLFISYLLCIVSTALLFFSSANFLTFTIIFIILSNLGFSLSEIFVSSFLPEISNKENIGRISGYAWAFGYIGGILSLSICLFYISAHNNSDTAIKFTTVITALFFGLFALPSFFLLKERKKSEVLPYKTTVLTIGFSRLSETFKDLKKHKELFKFLVSFFFFTCGSATVISFAGIFAQNVLQFKMDEIILLIIVSNITSAIGAFVFGIVQDIIGAKQTLIISLLIWIIAVTGAYFVQEKSSFWIVANIVGFAMGASQSASRSLVGIFSPKEKSAEFFSFWGVAGKSAAIFGLFVFGSLLKLFDMRSAVLVTSVFFFTGLVILLFVNVDKGVEE